MLDRITNIVNQAKSLKVDSGTLFCCKYKVKDKECLSFLLERECFDQNIFVEDINDGNIIDMQLSLHGLGSLGFYYNFESFVCNNKYQKPIDNYYIYEIKSSKSNKNEDILKYEAVIDFINALKQISKYKDSDAGVDRVVIFREDKSIFLSLQYEYSDIVNLDINIIDKLKNVSEAFLGEIGEKQFLYINELIDFSNGIDDDDAFVFILAHFSDYYAKCNNAYQFYLTGYSDKKLRIELDSKVLDFTQRIQSVINESQTKLIAIPTAFILACTAFDYKDLFSVKNLAIIIALFMFAVIIQLFLNNQKTALLFIKDRVNAYKNEMGHIELLNEKFVMAEEELKKQRARLKIVEVILWMLPIGLCCVWLFLLGVQLILYSIGGVFLILMIILKLLLC